MDPYGADAPLATLEQFKSWILEEDDDVLVINKPGWFVCHPSKNGPYSSLAGVVREYLGEGAKVHLVARLDRETSGLVIFAKRPAVSRALQMAFQDRWVDKEYIAILCGRLEERQEVSAAIEDDRDSAVHVKQRVVNGYGGQKAQTTFIPLEHHGDLTWARVIPHTGRKHQIRVHAAHLGHPVLGDKLYGPDERWYLEFIEKGWTAEMAAALRSPRQCLHAHRLKIDTEKRSYAFTAPIPEEWGEFKTRGVL